MDELDDRQARLVGAISEQFTTVPNAVLTIVRAPDLYEAFLPLGTKLLGNSAFSARHRELVILRTAVAVGSAYEWGQHAVLSRGVVDDDDLQRVVRGPRAPGWTPIEAALLTAVDELHEHGGISDTTWALLAADLDEHQLIELPMLVGQYHMMAFVFHALGVQPEAGSPGLPAATTG